MFDPTTGIHQVPLAPRALSYEATRLLLDSVVAFRRMLLKQGTILLPLSGKRMSAMCILLTPVVPWMSALFSFPDFPRGPLHTFEPRASAARARGSGRNKPNIIAPGRASHPSLTPSGS